jgi:hypothetical protein
VAQGLAENLLYLLLVTFKLLGQLEDRRVGVKSNEQMWEKGSEESL